MLDPAISILHEIHKLPLGEVFRYILSAEWGLSQLPIKCEASLNDCHSVHYEKPKAGKDESENEG
jgi:hypothetical protein